MSDTDGTFNFLISMIYTQMFNFLCEKADDVYGGRLPVHEEETVARIGNDDIRKDSMGVFTAVAEYAHDAEILFLLSAGQEVNDGSAIIIVDVTVSGTSTDGTCFQLGLKLLHVGVKKRF